MKRKNTKISCQVYNDYELDSFAAYLERQGAAGWELTSKTGAFLGFRRCEPKQVRVNAELVYANQKDADLWEYDRYCREAGWKTVFRDGKIKILENPDLGAEPISTDPETKFNTIHRRCLKMNILLPLVLLIAVAYATYRMWSQTPDSYEEYMSAGSTFYVALSAGIAILLLMDMVSYLLWYGKARKAVALGIHPSYTRGRLQRVIGYIALMSCVIVGFSGSIYTAWHTKDMKDIIALCAAILMVIAALTTTIWLEAKHNQTRESSRGRGLIIGLAFLLLTYPVFWIIYEWDDADARHITVGGEEITVYNDTIPLTMEDLGIETTDYTNRSSWHAGGSVLREERYWDKSANEEGYTFIYDVHRTDNGDAYQKVLEERYENLQGLWEEISDPAFGAKKVYKEMMDRWLLLYDDTIVDFETDIPLTEQQKKVIGEKIGRQPVA